MEKIWQEKIHWIGIQIISGSAELSDEFSQIPLRIQIEVKTGEKDRKRNDSWKGKFGKPEENFRIS